MRVLVTRPALQAADWVAQLRGVGIDAVALPLISIAPAADAAAVQAAWADLPALQLAVFVSPNAVEQFMAARPPGTDWPGSVRAGSTGPGTTQVLLRLGVPAARIVEPAADETQFDSEALWRRLAHAEWCGTKVLIVRGDGGREWLADTLRGRGAEVSLLAAYQRSAPPLDAPALALLQAALSAPRSHLWLFSSSEAIANLGSLAGPLANWSQARALASHPRIAARAQQLGLTEVTLTQPTLTAVRACLQSLPP